MARQRRRQLRAEHVPAATLLRVLAVAVILWGLCLSRIALAQDEATDDGTDTEALEIDAPEREPRRVDLPEAISLGLTRSPRIDAAELSTQKAAIVVDEADWAWTPKLELNLTLAPFPEASATSTDAEVLSEASGVGIFTKNSLEFLMPIFTSTKLSTAEELAEIGLDVEKLREEEARLQVTWDVTRAYYGLQLANAGVGVLDESVGLLDRVEREWQELYDAGNPAVERTDQYEIDIARVTVEAVVVETRNKQQLARKALRVHTKLDDNFRVPTMRFTVDEVELRPLEEVQQLAMNQRLDLQQLRRGLEAADLAAHLEWLHWWPDFYIAGGINAAYNNAVPDVPGDDEFPYSFYLHDPYNAFGVGILVGMRWKLDPVNRAFKVDQADTEAAKVAAQAELAVSGAMLQVEESWLGVKTAQSRVDLARKGRRAAKRIMTQRLLDYEAGGGDVDQVIRAVNTYFEARSAFLIALHDFRVALAKLRLHTGAESVDQLLSDGALEDYAPDEGDDAPDPDEE